MKYSQLIQSLEESATLALAAKVRELKAAGRDVVGLTLGEPDFDTPEHIREAAKKALDDGYTHYPPVTGLPELKEAISRKFKRENGLDYSTKQILVSTGAKQSLYNIILSLMNPGDEAILPAPFWVTYDAQMFLAQARTKVIQTGIDEGFKLSPEKLEEALGPNSKLLILTTPSNPSGAMYSEEELAGLVAVIEKYPNLHVVCDEIYEHITYGPKHVSLASFTTIAERVITVNGFAKGYAMTGWRLGYMAANEEIVKLCTKLQGQCTSGANSFAQKGAVAALNGDMAPTYAMREAFKERRDIVYGWLGEIEGLRTLLPEGAFYFYPDFGAFLGKKAPNGQVMENIDDLCFYLLESKDLALVTGSGFGTQTHARISYAYSLKTLEEGIGRLREGLLALT